MSVSFELPEFLKSTDVVDWQRPNVRSLASELGANLREPVAITKRCFEWVRDEIQHCIDFRRTELTCSASEVLQYRTGFCYAKSHLLAALLRANNIPAGFCYQRLSLDGVKPPFTLHGFSAVWLPEIGWYRVDARGNKPGVSAQFSPPVERLAFATTIDGEFDIRGIFADPLLEVVDVLRRYDDVESALKNLPDCDAPDAFTSRALA